MLAATYRATVWTLGPEAKRDFRIDNATVGASRRDIICDYDSTVRFNSRDALMANSIRFRARREIGAPLINYPTSR